jgi:Histidine kinase-, DNA gyrase B-, and HSP90-like ATPase
VKIGLIRDNGENIVRVKDTGSGICEHERDVVLRRFYQSDKVRHTSGLGLGLNLVAFDSPSFRDRAAWSRSRPYAPRAVNNRSPLR